MITFKEWLVNIFESDEEHHVTAVPLVGFAPHSHDGHAMDLGGTVHGLPGKHKVIGISQKASLLSAAHRKRIFKRQLDHRGFKGIDVHPSTGAGDTLRKAADKVANKKGKRVLHIVVGKDREKFGHALKTSLHAGKIAGIEADHFHEIHVHTPKDENRSHGMSGTNMRKAAQEGNVKEFHRHLGGGFSRPEATKLMSRVKDFKR